MTTPRGAGVSWRRRRPRPRPRRRVGGPLTSPRGEGASGRRWRPEAPPPAPDVTSARPRGEALGRVRVRCGSPGARRTLLRVSGACGASLGRALLLGGLPASPPAPSPRASTASRRRRSHVAPAPCVSAAALPGAPPAPAARAPGSPAAGRAALLGRAGAAVGGPRRRVGERRPEAASPRPGLRAAALPRPSLLPVPWKPPRTAAASPRTCAVRPRGPRKASAHAHLVHFFAVVSALPFPRPPTPSSPETPPRGRVRPNASTFPACHPDPLGDPDLRG